MGESSSGSVVAVTIGTSTQGSEKKEGWSVAQTLHGLRRKTHIQGVSRMEVGLGLNKK